MLSSHKLLFTSLTLLAFSTGCQQADFGGNCGEINGYSFSDMDSNRDGKIRAGEFKGGLQTQSFVQADFSVKACQARGGNFSQVDADSDGNITQAEFDKYSY